MEIKARLKQAKQKLDENRTKIAVAAAFATGYVATYYYGKSQGEDNFQINLVVKDEGGETSTPLASS